MLKWTMVRYKLKADRGPENESYIRDVFEQLKRESPAGMSYASYKLPDGVSFVHVAGYEEGGANPLTQLTAFKTFTSAIQERCIEPPAAVELSEIGSYNG